MEIYATVFSDRLTLLALKYCWQMGKASCTRGINFNEIFLKIQFRKILHSFFECLRKKISKEKLEISALLSIRANKSYLLSKAGYFGEMLTMRK